MTRPPPRPPIGTALTAIATFSWSNISHELNISHTHNIKYTRGYSDGRRTEMWEFFGLNVVLESIDGPEEEEEDEE